MIIRKNGQQHLPVFCEKHPPFPKITIAPISDNGIRQTIKQMLIIVYIETRTINTLATFQKLTKLAPIFEAF